MSNLILSGKIRDQTHLQVTHLEIFLKVEAGGQGSKFIRGNEVKGQIILK